MTEYKVTCDFCECDLTSTSNCVGYRILVTNEIIPSRGGAVTAVHITPSLARDLNFCRMACLCKWVKKVYE